MIHAPDKVRPQVQNVYENLIRSDYPDGYYSGALLRREGGEHYALNGFEPRWTAAGAWGIDCYREEDDSVVVGFFGNEDNFLEWYGEVVNAGMLARDPGDGAAVQACRKRALEGGDWRRIYQPEGPEAGD
ncbi:MAG TPA: hypothetical protein VFA95_04200 [Gammaproteobacteria bacterium]|nr:hypothetical protein [Gammaproteobacteria bacterium]